MKNPGGKGIVLSFLAGLSAMATPAAGQEVTIRGGVTVTSNYVFRSVTQSDNDPAVQPWLEIESSGFYARVWGSGVSFDDPGRGRAGDDYEVDYFLGYRSSFRGIRYDIGYARYTFDDSGDCCGEAQLTLGIPVTEDFDISPFVGYDTAENDLAAALTATYHINDILSVSGTYGRDNRESQDYWDAGFSYALNQQTSVDLRYHDSSKHDSLIVASLSYNFTLFGR